MVSVTFYGGVKQIGGNKILLEDKGTKIFLDFGMGFVRRGKFFEEFLTPRTANGIGDFLAMGLIPDINGVYREDLLKQFGRQPEEPVIDSVFLSHAHADHANYISFLHKDIPVYCGETAKLILDAVNEQSQRDIENEVIDFKPRPLFRCDYRKPPTERNFRTFRTGDRIKIGSMEIEPVNVDHCLTEDTFIQLADGELAKVKDVKNSSFINVINMKNGQIIQSSSSKSKYNTSQVLKIKTRFGEIKSTEEQRFFCLNGLNILEKKAKDLTNTDYLIYIKQIEFKGKRQELPKIKIRKVIKVLPSGLTLIKEKRNKLNLIQNELAKKVGLSKFYGDFERGRFGIELNRLKRILKYLKINENLFIQKYVSENRNIKIPKKTSPELLQLLGYTIGDGSWNVKSKKSPYMEIADKDKKNLELYQKIAKSLFNDEGRIVKKHGNRNILHLSTYIGRLFHEISPFIFSKSQTRTIPKMVHKTTIKEIAAFLKGLYDAEGSFADHSIILTSTSKDLIDMTKLLLLRFGILSWIYEFIESITKSEAYQLTISYSDSIIKFEKEINFGSEAKKNKLKKFLTKNKKSSIERIDLIPFNGEFLKKALKDMKITSWDFHKSKINIGYYMKGKHLVSRKKLKQIFDFLKKCKKDNKKVIEEYIKKIEYILSIKAVFVPIKSIKITNGDFIVYDFEVPEYHNFIANGFLVHNSVPGSYGFIIHTTKGPIIYTGDLRLHGNNPQMTFDFIEKAKEVKPIAMITEGTRINEKEDRTTENDVYEMAKDIALKTKELLVVDFNFKDVDRFRTFYRIAKEIGRKMVISFKHACFLERYHLDKQLNVPDSKDENILLLKPKRGSGTYDDKDYSEKFIKDRLNYQNIITAEEISKNQSRYMVILNFWYFNTFVDLKPREGSVYIHSLSEPFNEEMEISENRMNNWLEFFGLRKEHIHCSGHAPGHDLKEMIEAIRPKVIYPIHTEHPGMFRRLGIKTKMVKEGVRYRV